jgi:lipid-binding SYLF domain-containing protein
MAHRRTAFLALLALLAAGVSAGAAESKNDAAAVLAKFKEKDPGFEKVFHEAHGYAVFPTVGKGAIGIGGAHGKGDVFERGVLIGTTSLTQVTIGFQLGGQAYSEVILFKDKTARASRDLAYNRGVAIVTMGKGGLMYEASVGGQKFSFKPLESH